MTLLPQHRVVAAVEEVPEQRDRGPAEEHVDRHRSQVGDDPDAADDREDREHRVERHLEAARQVGRGAPEDHHADRHDQERGQRPDAGHLGQEVDGQQPGQQRDHDRHDDRGRHRRQRARVQAVEERGHHAVAAHREEDARLAVDHDQRDAEDRDHGAGGQQGGRPGRAGNVLEDGREARLLAVEVGRRLGGDGDDGHEHVDARHHHQGDEDRQRQVPAWVLDLLPRGRDRIETDVGEEDDARARHHAAEPERREVRQVVGVPAGDANEDEQHQHARA